MDIDYYAETTASNFHKSMKVVRGIMGPVGSGKSVTCLMEGLMISSLQEPNDKGIRKTRGAIVRNTYEQLSTTTLNTYKQWIPEFISPIVKHPMITTTLKQLLGDGTRMEMEVYFLSLDRDEDVRKLLSMEITWLFANEARELVYAVIKAARERIGRYPAEIDGYSDVWKDGKLIYDAPKERNPDGTPALDEDGEVIYTPCTRKALLLDTNPCDDDHWWYQLAEEGCLRKSENKDFDQSEVARVFDFFRIPSPLIKHKDGTYTPNPGAENIKHLPGRYQYYLDMIAGNAPDHINVMVLGNYGTIQEGKPVYRRYNDVLHCGTVKPIKSLPLCLGWDYGLTPSVIGGQLTDTGQMRVIFELVSDDMNVRQFARDVVKPFLQMNFAGYRVGFSLADPAGNNRGEGEGKTATGILNDDYVDSHNDTALNMGFTTDDAPTNDPPKRIDAVEQFMIKLVDRGEPGYIADKSCKVLRKGKIGAYHYKKVRAPGQDERFREAPDKNYASHPADAEQYLALGFVGGYVVDYDPDDYDEETQHHDDSALGWA